MKLKFHFLYFLSGASAFAAPVSAPGDDGSVQTQSRPLCMINLCHKLCVHPVQYKRYISSNQSWGHLADLHKMHFSRLGDHFPETMASLVGRGFARSSRNLLNATALRIPSNLVCAVKSRAEVKGFKYFSSSCSAGARLYTERHEWVT